MTTLADDQAGAPYSALARVYDRWMAADRIPYEQWYEFTSRRFAEAGRPVRTVLDVCCGTGMTIRRLQDHGYTVFGVDAAPEMLAVARERVEPGTVLRALAMPDDRVAELGPVDAALVCFDGANYFTGPDALPVTLRLLAGVLSPGGVVVFDLSTRPSFEEIAGMGQFGEDFGDFAYLWRTRHEPDTPRYDYVVSLFVQEGETFRRVVEHHRQRWFARAEVEAALAAAGFVDITVHDNYREVPAVDTTRRDTWSARLP